MVHDIADTDELRWRTCEVFGWIANGKLDARISRTYPLAEAAQAQEDLAAPADHGQAATPAELVVG
jgi:NADPH2:quinone reductase